MHVDYREEQTLSAMRTYFWDFFGPRAERTAEHYKNQVDAYIEKYDIEGGTTGVRVLENHHHVTWCRVPLAEHDRLYEAHRPKRWVDQ